MSNNGAIATDTDKPEKRNRASKIRRQIRRDLAGAIGKKSDILAATAIIMEAVKLEDTLKQGSVSDIPQSNPARKALNKLWDAKALEYGIYPESASKQRELFSRILAILPARADIKNKISELTAARDKLLAELIILYRNGHYLAVMHKAASSRWSDVDAVNQLFIKAQEQFTQTCSPVFATLPELIYQKRNYELNQKSAKLDSAGMALEGWQELRQHNAAMVAQAKILYERACEKKAAGKLPSAARKLFRLMAFCPDYPGAAQLFDDIKAQIAKCSDAVEEARKYLAARKYNHVIKLLKPLTVEYHTEEIESIYNEAVRQHRRIFKIGLVILVIILLTLMVVSMFAIDNYYHQKSFLAYRKSADAAIAAKDYVRAIENYGQALKVPGYNTNQAIIKQIEQARAMLYHKIPDIGMEFVWIKALDCWAGKYEVTNYEYRKFKPGHDSKSFGKHTLNGDRQPVVYVNYQDAVEYAKWLTERELKANRIPAGYRYRLPTKQEWTTFCQIGGNRKFPWGDSMPPKYGNYSGKESATDNKIDGYCDDYPVTCPVENSGRNEWGLYGVGGNVWECTVKSSSDLSFDAWRGASWSYSIPDCLTTAATGVSSPEYRIHGFGFRLVLAR
jgi:hypothetical protein